MNARNKLVCVLGRPFHSSVMFTGKAVAYLRLEELKGWLRSYLQTLDEAGRACQGLTL
jgi:hypothetical protein